MTKIKSDLKQVITDTMLPESEAYLEELNDALENGTISEDEKEAIRDMESFLVELQNILLAIEENKITDVQASEVYDNILKLLNEHEHDE